MSYSTRKPSQDVQLNKNAISKTSGNQVFMYFKIRLNYRNSDQTCSM